MLSTHSCPLGKVGGENTGGMSVYIRELARELGRRGHLVDVYTRIHEPAHDEIAEIGQNVRLIHLKAGEKEIEKLVLEEYQWETAVDTKTTWRIGDGTAAFYNYIYYTVAGFSEYDTFRSNQIREGMLSREEGMQLVMRENRPRYASLKWYTDILNLDFPGTIKIINSIPKLYR